MSLSSYVVSATHMLYEFERTLNELSVSITTANVDKFAVAIDHAMSLKPVVDDFIAEGAAVDAIVARAFKLGALQPLWSIELSERAVAIDRTVANCTACFAFLIYVQAQLGTTDAIHLLESDRNDSNTAEYHRLRDEFEQETGQMLDHLELFPSPKFFVVDGMNVALTQLLNEIEEHREMLGRVSSFRQFGDANTIPLEDASASPEGIHDNPQVPGSIEPDDISDIAERLKKGERVPAIARALGLTQVAIVETKPCVAIIRKLAKAKTTQKGIAAELGVDRKLVGKVGAANGIEFGLQGQNFCKSPT